jgi:hypothetical protein
MARRDVCEEDQLYWQQYDQRWELVVNWVREEWAEWERETGEKLTVAPDGLRKHLHEWVDLILGDERRAAAKVVPLRGPHA